MQSFFCGLNMHFQHRLVRDTGGDWRDPKTEIFLNSKKHINLVSVPECRQFFQAYTECLPAGFTPEAFVARFIEGRTKDNFDTFCLVASVPFFSLGSTHHVDILGRTKLTATLCLKNNEATLFNTGVRPITPQNERHRVNFKQHASCFWLVGGWKSREKGTA